MAGFDWYDYKPDPSIGGMPSGGGFGGGVTPGSSFDPPSGFPSAGDSGFWKNQPTDPDYYNKGKAFLDAFKNFKLEGDENKYQRQAQQGGGFQTSSKGSQEGGPNGGKIRDNLGYLSQPGHAPVFSPGVQGSPGFGGAIGQIGGAVAGALIPGIGPGLGSTIGGSIGRAFG
jgi:hypothetical protein